MVMPIVPPIPRSRGQRKVFRLAKYFPEIAGLASKLAAERIVPGLE